MVTSLLISNVSFSLKPVPSAARCLRKPRVFSAFRVPIRRIRLTRLFSAFTDHALPRTKQSVLALLESVLTCFASVTPLYSVLTRIPGGGPLFLPVLEYHK